MHRARDAAIDVAAAAAGDALGFFAAMHAVFRQAKEVAGERRSIGLRIAGRSVCMRFAGPALLPVLAPAFAHLLRSSAEPPDLTVCCWDDASTGVTTPEPRVSADRAGIEFVDGPVKLAWEPGQRAIAAFSATQRLALVRFQDAGAVPVWERAAPLRRILHWWASGLGLQLVHAAAVGTRQGGVLLVGRGGSGKSTTALACVGSALGYAGDDYCLLSFDDGPRVHALYGSGKADAASGARLPRLQSTFAASALRGEGKSVIFVEDSFPGTMIDTFPLRAVVVPRIAGDAACRLDPMPRAAALRAVAPSTLFQLPGDRGESLSRLAALVRELPCWQLSLGPDPAAAQPLLENLLRNEARPR